MKQTVLITGANGFVAGHLGKKLKNDYTVKFLTRNPKVDNEFAWDLDSRTIDKDALTDVDYIVHLSGSRFNDGAPFTEEKIKVLSDSRIGAANFLREQLQESNQKLKAFISASAIGYYALDDDRNEIDETGHKATGFAADLCEEWEKAAHQFKIDGIASHVCVIRVPEVLGVGVGIFPSYVEKVKEEPQLAEQENNTLVLWGHVEDTAGIFEFAVRNTIDGTYNSVAPQPASVQDLYKAIANNIQSAQYSLEPFKGKYLVSTKIIETGYAFKYADIQVAVDALLSEDRSAHLLMKDVLVD